jgi:hypothetical protein
MQRQLHLTNEATPCRRYCSRCNCTRHICCGTSGHTGGGWGLQCGRFLIQGVHAVSEASNMTELVKMSMSKEWTQMGQSKHAKQSMQGHTHKCIRCMHKQCIRDTCACMWVTHGFPMTIWHTLRVLCNATVSTVLVMASQYTGTADGLAVLSHCVGEGRAVH